MRYAFDRFVLDIQRRELRRRGELVPLEPQLFDLLTLLLRCHDRVVHKEELIAEIWGGRIVSESALSSRISTLRSCLGDDGKRQRLIKTVPRKGIRFVGDVHAGGGPVDEPSAVSPPWLCNKPQIAVLTFENLAGDRLMSTLCHALAIDLRTELTRFQEFVVTDRVRRAASKQSTLEQFDADVGTRYLVKGSIRRGDRQIVINVHLVDVTTNTYCWSERFEHGVANSVAEQIAIAQAMAPTLASHVRHAELRRSLLKPIEFWQASDYFLRAQTHWEAAALSPTPQVLRETRDLLARSLSIDSTYAPAHALLAETFLTAWQRPLDDDYIRPDALERACLSANEALKSDQLSAQTHATLTYVLAFQGRHEEAIAEVDATLALNPNLTDWRLVVALLTSGEHLRAIEHSRALMRADPFYSVRAALWTGVAHYMSQDHEAAQIFLQEAARRSPGSRSAHLWSAANFAQLGRGADALRELSRARMIDPDFSLRLQRRLASVCKRGEDIEHHLDGLRKAGLPER